MTEIWQLHTLFVFEILKQQTFFLGQDNPNKTENYHKGYKKN